FFFSSRRRHTRSKRDWSSDVCSSDLGLRGHVDPLPEDAGAFRLTRDEPEGPARIEAHDEPGRRAARAMLARLDAPSRARTGNGRSEERRVGKECRSTWAAVQGRREKG